MRIGLSQRVLFHSGRAYDSIEHSWYRYLNKHTLFFIPNIVDQQFDQLAEELDVLILTGGDDSTLRRTVELKIATQMMMLQKPILGVCHGCFLLEDILGGDIVEVDNHRDTVHNINYLGHPVEVNSHHSLAIATSHSAATVLATDAEGHCEAWIDRNLAGVAWHPERMRNPFLPSEISLLLKI